MSTPPVRVGAVLLAEKAKVVFPTPRMVGASRSAPLSQRAVQACPAVNTLESRLAEILSPFSIRLRCVRMADNFSVHVVPSETRLDAELIPHFVSVMPRDFWRNENYPVVQISIPWCFVCDEACYITQLPPFADQSFSSFPGLFISGRFPTHLWPRSLNLAFEWSDFDNDLIIKRGRPISYIHFETARPEAPIVLRKARLTPELKSYRSNIDDVPKFTSGSFKLMDPDLLERPNNLLEYEV